MKRNKMQLFYVVMLLAYGLYLMLASVVAPETGSFKGAPFNQGQGVLAALVCLLAGAVALWGCLRRK